MVQQRRRAGGDGGGGAISGEGGAGAVSNDGGACGETEVAAGEAGDDIRGGGGTGGKGNVPEAISSTL